MKGQSCMKNIKIRALHRFGDMIFKKCAWLKVPQHTIPINKTKL